MRYYVTPFPDGLRIRARAEAESENTLGDLDVTLRPDEDFDGVAYGVLSAAAESQGYIDIPDGQGPPAQ